MENRIGQVAGKVWRYIDKVGECSVSELTGEIDAPRSKVCMAVGWLAREDKIRFENEGRGSTLRLK